MELYSTARLALDCFFSDSRLLSRPPQNIPGESSRRRHGSGQRILQDRHKKWRPSAAIHENQLEPCDNNLISLEDVPDLETSFRAVVGADSVTGIQGRSCLCMN